MSLAEGKAEGEKLGKEEGWGEAREREEGKERGERDEGREVGAKGPRDRARRDWVGTTCQGPGGSRDARPAPPTKLCAPRPAPPG